MSLRSMKRAEGVGVKATQVTMVGMALMLKYPEHDGEGTFAYCKRIKSMARATIKSIGFKQAMEFAKQGVSK